MAFARKKVDGFWFKGLIKTDGVRKFLKNGNFYINIHRL